MYVSVLLPTKNENEKVLTDLVKRIRTELHGVKYEIVMIDRSISRPHISGVRVVQQKTNGYGNAIIEGFRATQGDRVMTMDADGSHDPKDIMKLIERSKQFDIVMGSRYSHGSRTGDMAINILASRFFCTLASFVLGLGLKDPMNGFSIIRKEAFLSSPLNPYGYKIHMEIIFKSKKRGYTASEVPTTFHKRITGKSNRGFGFREGIRIIQYIFELRFGLR